MQKTRFYKKLEEHFESKITKNQAYIIGTVGILFGHFQIVPLWQVPMLIGGWIVLDMTFSGIIEGKPIFKPAAAVNENGDAVSK